MGWIIFGIVAVILIGVLVTLYILGNRMQKKQLEQKKQMVDAAQPATMLIIDKKIMPMKDAGLPKIVMEQTPKKYQKAKVPVVKAKIGPQIMTLICDDAIFDDVPKRGEVKAMVSGIYLVSVKSIRKVKKSAAEIAEEEANAKKKKKGFREKMRAKQVAYQKQLSADMESQKSKEEEKKYKERVKKEREREKKIEKF